MGRAHIVSSVDVAQTVEAVNAYISLLFCIPNPTCMTVFTGLGKVAAAGLTVGDNRLGRLIGQGSIPGAREVAAVTVVYTVRNHMLGQLRLGILHVDMTRLTVRFTRTAGIGISKVVMTRLSLNMRVAHTVEVLQEARTVVAIFVAGRTV